MDWNNLYNVFLIILNLPCIVSQVYWNVSSVPAMFGQNTNLTCHLEYILTNPKDCPVRQWSGGPEHKGLVYNGYSSNNNKYKEDIYFGSFDFSLIIKNLTASDINVNYSCSCGFQSSTRNLSLNENWFHYPPTGINVKFSFENDLLLVFLDLQKVYPVPNCSLYFGSHLKSSSCNVQGKWFVYSVTYNASYRLLEKDCNKQPELECKFEHVAEPVTFQGNETYECSDVSETIQSCHRNLLEPDDILVNDSRDDTYVLINIGRIVYESIPLFLNNATRIHVPNKDSQTTKFPTLTVALIAAAVMLLSIFIIIIAWKYTQRCRCKCKRSIKKEAKHSKEKKQFIELQ